MKINKSMRYFYFNLGTYDVPVWGRIGEGVLNLDETIETSTTTQNYIDDSAETDTPTGAVSSFSIDGHRIDENQTTADDYNSYQFVQQYATAGEEHMVDIESDILVVDSWRSDDLGTGYYARRFLAVPIPDSFAQTDNILTFSGALNQKQMWIGTFDNSQRIFSEGYTAPVGNVATGITIVAPVGATIELSEASPTSQILLEVTSDTGTAVPTTVLYSTSDDNIVTVSSSGVMTYVAAGTATITCKTNTVDSVSETIEVTCV